jgi:hypothetical protein
VTLPFPKNRTTNTTAAATLPRRKPNNQLYVPSLSVREEIRVVKKEIT